MNLAYKFKKFINNRILRTPGVAFLRKTSNLKKKRNHLNFWINRSKANKSINNFFFKSTPLDKKENIRFSSNNNFLIEEEIFSSLADHGLIIIENALPLDEKKKIIRYLDDLKNVTKEMNWLETISSSKRNNETSLNVGIPDINDFPILKKYSDQFSKKIYGKCVLPSVQFHYLKLLNYVEEDKIRGETYLHSDRFLPHFKIFYSPYSIGSGDAPFRFCLGTHKINDDYLNFFENSDYFDETDINCKKIMNNKKIETVTTKPNTLYLCFTNGFHSRSPFLNSNSERSMVFLQYVERFNKLDYLLNS
jgi:hypothetical protein